jgi:peptidoglycan glycosyltransferase
MRHFVRVFCLVAALGLLGYGMLQPVKEDTRWLLALWLAAPLLLVAARLSLPAPPRGFSRSIQNLGLVIGLGFVLLSLQLLRQQFVSADTIVGTVHVDEQTGQTTSNVRRVIQSMRVQRGKILDRNDAVLVNTQVVADGFAVRIYPLADQINPAAYGNIVGFYSHRYGESGLESTYGDYLSGESDSYGRIRDSLLGKQQVGDDLHLTIDARLQAAVTGILGGRTGSIVVLDPRTGAVLAMVSQPSFDPRGLAFNPAADRTAENERIEAYWKQINGEGAGQPLLNRPTQGRYPPGSTFKTITAVGILQHPEQGRPDEIDCPNTRETEAGAPPVVNAVQNLAGFTGHPSNLERVYAFSCNTAFAEYSMRLGADLMADTAREFDIFRPQDAPEVYEGFTDLPALPSLLYVNAGFLNRRAALADTGFGQGELLITPLQMAMVAAAIGNDGVMMQPYLVERVTRPDGSVVVARGPRAIRRSMSSEIAERMRVNMRAGVSYGFGKAAQQVDPNVALVGGKSGTAEHGPGTTPHAWFIAIAPVEQSRYAVAVMVENGADGAGLGADLAGQTLAAAFALEE